MNYDEAKAARIEYLCEGQWCDLREHYPIFMAVADYPERIFLDTGGPMSGCSFFVVELRDDGYMWEVPPTGARAKEPFRLANRWRVVK